MLEALTTVAEAHPAFFTPPVLTTLVPLLQSLCALPSKLAASLPEALRCTPLTEEEADFEKSYARLTSALNLLVTLFHRVKKAALTRSGAFTVGIQLVPVLLAWLAIGISPYDLGSQEERETTEAWIERDDVSLSPRGCHPLSAHPKGQTEEEDDEYTEMPEYGLDAFASVLRESWWSIFRRFADGGCSSDGFLAKRISVCARHDRCVRLATLGGSARSCRRCFACYQRCLCRIPCRVAAY